MTSCRAMEIITQKSLTAKIRPIFVVTSTQGSSHACVSTIYPALTKETIVDVCSQIVSDSSPTQCTQIDVCSRCQELWLYQQMDQNTFPFQWTRPHLNKPMQNQERKYHDMHLIALAISNSVIPYFSIHTFSLNNVRKICQQSQRTRACRTSCHKLAHCEGLATFGNSKLCGINHCMCLCMHQTLL